MAQIIDPMQQITGLSASETSDELGTWNTSVDLTGSPYNVPSDASAVLIYTRLAAAIWVGFRNPADTTGRSGMQFDTPGDFMEAWIVPCNNGTVDLYTENVSLGTFYVAGYFESGAIEWLTAGNETTDQTTGSGSYTWDYTARKSDATGIIINQSQVQGDDIASFRFATTGSPTAYCDYINPNTSGGSDAFQTVIPLDAGQAAYVDTVQAATRTYNIVGYIKQDITFIYNDNSGPTEAPGTTGSWTAGTYDYGSEEGIGCLNIGTGTNNAGFWAASDSSEPSAFTVSARPMSALLMHTVDSTGNWNYYLETGTPTWQVMWFMGAHSAGGASGIEVIGTYYKHLLAGNQDV